MNTLKRFPHCKQLNASDCGSTSLRMVARFYGRDYSTEMLRRRYVAGRGGPRDKRAQPGYHHA